MSPPGAGTLCRLLLQMGFSRPQVTSVLKGKKKKKTEMYNVKRLYCSKRDIDIYKLEKISISETCSHGYYVSQFRVLFGQHP